VSWPDGRPRYVLASVTGYSIAPRGSGSTKRATGYFVLDRANCHRIAFAAPVAAHPYGRDEARLERALAALVELNGGRP
jgi:hypothetical protein